MPGINLPFLFWSAKNKVHVQLHLTVCFAVCLLRLVSITFRYYRLEFNNNVNPI